MGIKKNIQAVAMLCLAMAAATILLACNTVVPQERPGTHSEPVADDQEEGNPDGTIYDFYKTFEQARDDIQNGYIFSMDKSFSEAAVPIATTGRPHIFRVHHDNTLEIEIQASNLFTSAQANESWVQERDSLIRFVIYDPSGEVAFSYYKSEQEIEEPVACTATLDLYPGDWKYQVEFAYATDGEHPSQLLITAQYQDIYEEDVAWLLENKL